MCESSTAPRRWISAAALVVAGACSTPAPGPPNPGVTPSAVPSFARGALLTDSDRSVDPFPVLDEEGRPYEHPFLGGLNVPRPQFVDIDGDGDYDLFLQEHSNNLWFFENTGSAQRPRFVWRTDSFQDLDVGEWNRFVDIDGDGDYDLLAELPFSYVRLVRNEGTATAPRFVAGPDSVRESGGVALFADRQNIPFLVDLDCNGRVDLFLGRIDGSVARYEAWAPGSDRFSLLTEGFEGILIVGNPDSVGSRHGANTMAFADEDGDGDLDLYWGDFFEPGVLLIENTGRPCAGFFFGNLPRQIPADSQFTSGFNVPAPVDIDGDGDLDFIMGVLGGAFNPILTSVRNIHFWERTAEGRLELRTKRFLQTVDIGSESAPAFADLDGDGDLDLLVGGKIDPVKSRRARLYHFRNEGTPAAPSFRLADTLDLSPLYHYAPALGDLDGDGDPDLMLGTWNRGVHYFRNEGADAGGGPHFVRDSSVAVDLGRRASNATPALADVDGDGDLDLFVGEASGRVNFLRNEGSAERPNFVLVSRGRERHRCGTPQRPRGRRSRRRRSSRPRRGEGPCWDGGFPQCRGQGRSGIHSLRGVPTSPPSPRHARLRRLERGWEA